MSVDKESTAVEAMKADWVLVDALLGGTKSMRAASETLLPRWPMEDAAAYKARLATATLFPAYSETVAQMAGRLFGKPLQLNEDVPPQISAQLQNADLEGRDIDTVVGEWFARALHRGIYHALVDFPSVGTVKTRAEEQTIGARPYIVLIDPLNVIGWRSKKISGVETLLQVRIAELATADDGDFGTKSVPQIRVIEPQRWSTYREQLQDGKNVWVLYDEGVLSLKKIPLVTLYTNRTGFMQGKPPLLDLAYLNVKHWQSQSDQDTILHTARVPLLARIGADQGDDGKPMQIANSVVDLPMNGDLKYVEHTGAAITAGAESLKDLEDQMKAAGAKLLTRTLLSLSDSQAKDESDKELSQLGRMARNTEDSTAQVLQLFAEWQKLPEGGHVEIVADLGEDSTPIESADILLKSSQAGNLSKETYFAELQRRGLVTDDLTWEDELARIDQQGPSLGNIGVGNGGI